MYFDKKNFPPFYVGIHMLKCAWRFGKHKNTFCSILGLHKYSLMHGPYSRKKVPESLNLLESRETSEKSFLFVEFFGFNGKH